METEEGTLRPETPPGEIGPADPSAATSPTDPGLRLLAESLTPDRLVVLPFYHELRNALVKPERVKLQTEYFWLRWVPLLGPVRSLIVMRMRQYGYFNRQTRELRDECARTYDEIAASIGISARSLERYFENAPDPAGGPYRLLKDPLLGRFIRLRHQYVWRPGKAAPERTINEYKIAMDEPLTPEDEIAFRLAAARRLRVGPAADRAARPPRLDHTRQSGGYGAPPRHRRQSDGYADPDPDRQAVAAESAADLTAQPVVPSITSQPSTTTTASLPEIVELPIRRNPRPDLAIGRIAQKAGGERPGGTASVRLQADGPYPTGRESAEVSGSPDLQEMVATFEAANDRPASPLERRLLAALAGEFDPAARARGASGVVWVAAAVVEAVASGSRFVAPKRLREICRRWTRDGRPAEGHDETPRRDRPPVGRSPVAPSSRLAPAGSGRRGRPAAGRWELSTPLPGPASESDVAAPVAPLDSAEVPLGRPEPPTFAVLPAIGLTNKQLWAAVLDELQPGCPPGAFATWLKPTRLVGRDGEMLVVGAPNSFAREWLADRMTAPVARAVAAILGQERPVRFEVEEEWLGRLAGR